MQSQQPEHPGTTNYYYSLTHTPDIQEWLIIKVNKAILGSVKMINDFVLVRCERTYGEMKI